MTLHRTTKTTTKTTTMTTTSGPTHCPLCHRTMSHYITSRAVSRSIKVRNGTLGHGGKGNDDLERTTTRTNGGEGNDDLASTTNDDVHARSEGRGTRTSRVRRRRDDLTSLSTGPSHPTPCYPSSLRTFCRIGFRLRAPEGSVGIPNVINHTILESLVPERSY